MNTPRDVPDPDAELDARVRAARDPAGDRPPPAVRQAILDEARRVAAAAPGRRAANESHWRAPAIAAAVALVAVLIARPLYEAPLPPSPSPSSSSSTAPAHQVVAPSPVQAPTAAHAESPVAASAGARTAPSSPRPTAPSSSDSAAGSAPAAPLPSAARPVPPLPLAAASDLPLAATSAANRPAVAAAFTAPMQAAARAEALAAPAPAAPASPGRQALLRAIETRDADEVRRLLAAGADPNGADANGVTPLALADHLGDERISALLRAAGAR